MLALPVVGDHGWEFPDLAADDKRVRIIFDFVDIGRERTVFGKAGTLLIIDDQFPWQLRIVVGQKTGHRGADREIITCGRGAVENLCEGSRTGRVH